MMPNLTVVTGPMKAAKTTMLVEKVQAAVSVGISSQIFRPVSDTRCVEGKIVSRLGSQHPAIGVANPITILDYRSEFELAAIDEAQLFEHELYFTVEMLLMFGVEVIVAGLNLDYRGLAFPEMAKVIARATTIVQLKARCDICTEPADFTQRLLNNDPELDAFSPTIVIDGLTKYEARCKKCFVQPSNLKEYVAQI